MTIGDRLEKMGACSNSVKWASNYTSNEQAWADCERGDWMLWIAGRLSKDRKQVVLAACACARLSLKYASKGEERPRIAIETAEAWCGNGATLAQVKAAAYGAADAGAADAAAYAAYAADAAARRKTLKECADICRRMLPMPIL